MEGYLIFGAPLLGAVIAGFGLSRDWSSENHRLTEILAIVLAILAALLGFGTFAYIQLVHSLPEFIEYGVGAIGLLLSLVAMISGMITLRSPRWFSTLAFGVSTWMVVWFFFWALPIGT